MTAQPDVRIELLDSPEDLGRLEHLFASIWRAGDGQAPINAHVMRALEHAGNYVAGAYDGSTLVGGSVAFFGNPAAGSLHSHITGVAADVQGKRVGLALKLHQLGWAVERGAREITWTFDPLVRRNAYFNIAKLGALPTEYLPDFYGEMDDAINAGQGSDRLFVSWPVEVPPTSGSPAEPAGADLLLDEDAAGGPVRRDVSTRSAQTLVRVPADIDEVRRVSPDLGHAWRAAVRETLGAELASGARVTGFSSDGCYVLDRVAP